jgi:glycosyltransferase involved in cell wall biosynthesis
VTAPIRLTIVMTHPVQYYAPWFRRIASACPELDLTVVYATEPTPRQQGAGFGRAFAWDVPLRQGYPSVIVRPAREGTSVHSNDFWSLNVPEISAAIRATRPDVVLINGWYSITLLRAIWACRRAGIPMLYRGDTHLGNAPSGWRRLLWNGKTRLLLKQFAGALSVGSRTRQLFERFGVPAERIFDVPHFVDNAYFAAAAAPHQTVAGRAAARASFGLKPNDFVPLFVGKLEPKKRPLETIRAVAGMRPGARLLVVGAGSLEEACRREAERLGVAVSWAGFLNQSEIGRAYAAADCLVLPSDAGETWGLVVNEALATGLPCVVSDHVGCAPDLVTPGVTGEIAPLDDVPALTAALERMRQCCEAGHDWKPACRERADEYSMDRASEGLVEACQAMARRSARPALRPPRVVACCGSMAIVSGLERMTFEVLRVLRERGAAVHCIINNWANWERPDEKHCIEALAEEIGASTSLGYYWYTLDRRTRNPLKLAQMAWDVLCTSLGLLRDAKRLRASHVLVPDMLTALRNAPALALLRLAGVGVVMRLGNAPAPGPAYRLVYRFGISPFVDRFLCNSQFTKQELLAHGIPEHKARLVYNTLPTRAASRPAAAVDPLRVVYVGQIIPPKGLHVLLDAAGLLAREGIDLRLDVVGDIDAWEPPAYAGYHQRLRQRADEADLRGRVRFLGWRSDVPEILAGVGVHCCPSLPEIREGFGLVVLEAKAAGCPSVVLPTGALPELIDHGKDGWVCEDATPEALAEGLRYFLTDARRRRQAGERARQSLARFSRPAFAEAVWTAFDGPGPAIPTSPPPPVGMQTRAG